MRRGTAALSAAIWMLTGAAHAFELNDSLKGSTAGKPMGGQLGADGWTVTATTDRLLYELPRLVQGSAEFTVSGLTIEKLSAVDHEIFSMYDAGYGISEPINYNPQFRNNAFKVLVRIYGQKEPSRTGQQKFLLAFCPLGAPGYTESDCPCAAGPYNEEPFGGDPNFDGSSQTFRVEWDATSARYFRNGNQIHGLSWASTGYVWGPDTLHLMLGSARNDLAPDVAMPLGVVYSDVKIAGTEGAAFPACATGAAGAGGESGSSGQGGSGGAAGDPGGSGQGGAPGCSPAISAGPVAPASGAGLAQSFLVTYAVCEPSAALRVVQFWVGDEVDTSKPYVSLGYEAGLLSMGSETCAPGEAKVLSNVFGSLDCAQTKVVPSGNDLAVDWALQFNALTFAGPHKLFVDAKDQSQPEVRLQWTEVGTWTVPASGAGGASGGSGQSGAGGGGSSGSSGKGGGGSGGAGGPGGAGGAGVGAASGKGGAAGKGKLSSDPSAEAASDDGGCGCRTSGRPRPSPAVALGLAALAAWFRRRWSR